MALKPLDTKNTRLATLKPFDIPIDGETYSIPPVDADLGLFLTELLTTISSAQAAEEAGVDADISLEQAERLKTMSAELQGDDTMARLIGLDNLTALRSRHSWNVVELVAWTVIIWTVQGREAGEEYWNTGGHPKAKKPQDRLPKGKRKG